MKDLKGDPVFPLKIKPWLDWSRPADAKDPSKRYFMAPRSKGRQHAGCDLMVPHGSEVLAVANGTVAMIVRNFLGSTDAIQVNHDGFIVIYGEVVPAQGLSAGDPVTRNNPIATVANQGRESQLHFELYLNESNGKVIVLRGGPPFNRALLPEDPAPYLLAWQSKSFAGTK